MGTIATSERQRDMSSGTLVKTSLKGRCGMRLREHDVAVRISGLGVHNVGHDLRPSARRLRPSCHCTGHVGDGEHPLQSRRPLRQRPKTWKSRESRPSSSRDPRIGDRDGGHSVQSTDRSHQAGTARPLRVIRAKSISMRRSKKHLTRPAFESGKIVSRPSDPPRTH